MLKALRYTAVALSLLAPVLISAGEKEDYLWIKTLYEKKSTDVAHEKSLYFQKRYPKSVYAKQIAFIAADSSSDVQERIDALEKYINRYLKSPLREKAFIPLVESYYLSGDYEKILTASARYAKLYPYGKANETLTRYSVLALLLTQNYAEGSRIAARQGGYPFALTAYAQHRSRGDKTFISKMATDKDLQTPPNLLLCATLFQQWGEYDRAFSAYRDITTRFPESPEAAVSAKRISLIEERKPRYITTYLSGTEKKLAIQAEDDLIDPAGAYYCVEIGPLFNLATAKTIKKEIRKDFGETVIVKKEREFSIYAGSFADSLGAVNLKVRLAEELGINGRIVYVRTEGTYEYYHGD